MEQKVMFKDAKLNDLKLSIFPKLIGRSYAIPIKISRVFVCEN